MNFKIHAIDHKIYQHLFKWSESELNNIQTTKITVGEKPGYPCRVSLQEADIGETVLLLPYKHHNVDSPYKASGPIFIRENVQKARLKVNEIPEILNQRFLSVRAYDDQNMMINAITTKGENLKVSIQKLFDNRSTHYLHIHNANPGCFNCYVERA